MHLVASVHLSVLPSVRLSVLSRLNCLTYRRHYQSKVFVCVSVILGRIMMDNSADTVDQLLILTSLRARISFINYDLRWLPN